MAGNTLWSFCLLFLSLGVCLAEITVNVSPEVDVIKGETARLPCSYSTSDKSVVLAEWYIDQSGTRKRVAYKSSTDSGLDSDTPFANRLKLEGMTLVITHINVDDERSFFCQVTAGPLGVKEDETKLKVFFAPEKPVAAPNNQNIIVDELQSSEVGTCSSRNGHPQPRIIWFKDNMPMPEVTDPKENIYVVPRVVRESTGLSTVTSTLYMRLKREDAKSMFHCTVEYAMPDKKNEQEDSESFKLSLHYPAENVYFKLLNDQPIKEGDQVKMKCETDGNPQPSFEFSKDDAPLQSSEGGVLTLMNVNRKQSGTYKCEALDFDSVGVELVRTLPIKVHYLDPVTIFPDGPITVNKGEAFDIQCKASSPDKFTLEWKKGRNILSKDGAFSVQSAALSDAGEYICVVSVPSVPGLVKEANVSVRVKGKPEIDEPLTIQVKKEGEPVTVSCSAQGFPAPQFTWEPSGKESVTVEGHKTISTLTLPVTADVLTGGVTCEAKNNLGLDKKQFRFEIISDNSVDSTNTGRAETQQGGSSGVVIAVVACVLVLLLLVATLYFLSKKGKACFKKEKDTMPDPESQQKSQPENTRLTDPEASK
ncbi:basal cell adhesion molecule isoform X2 [Hoplias malabaricus]|uniref:basal cell adhesion molecule isoform X2 n=1 Tax=Hoplias malabaricus TaxID=27720 RepID=UPI003461BE9D